jgi:translocation and assembly module TamB
MRRAAKWVGAVLAGLVVLVLLLLGAVVGGSATRPGQAAIERLVPPLTAGMLRVTGLTGWMFGASRIARIEVSDPHGTWLTIEGVTLDWSPLRLFAGQVSVRGIAADRVAVARRPVSSGSSGTIELPVRVEIATLHIGRLDLAAPAAGQAASLEVDGAARVDALDQGSVRLALHRLGLEERQDSPGTSPAGANPVGATPAEAPPTGTYTVDAQLDPAGLHAKLHVAEPAGGLIGSLAALPAIGAITADATLGGMLDSIDTDLALTAGALRAHVTGRVNATGHSADLAVSAEAPAMAPRPDLAWYGISLTGRVRGAFTKPDASARLVADRLVLGQAGVGRITADIQGDSGRLTLDGALDGIRLPGARPDVLAGAPLLVTASMRLDAAERPLIFSLRHPLFTIDGTAVTAGAQQAEAQVTVPEIAPLAAAGGIVVGGRAALTLRAARQNDATQIAVLGNFGVSGGPGPAATLLGQDTKLDVLATLRGQSVNVTRLNIDNNALSAGVSGTLAPGTIDVDWRLAVANLASLTPTLTGALRTSGKASGAPDHLTISADMIGEVGAAGIAPGAVTAQVTLAGLPDAPAGHVTASGTLLGAPLALAVGVTRENGLVRVAIERADWKSAHAEGTLLADPAVLVPQGQVSFAMTRLDDLQPLLDATLGAATLGGRTLRGSIGGKLVSTAAGATLAVSATNAGLAGTATVARATIDAKVADPISHPTLDGRLTLDDIAAGGVSGSARIEAKGTLDALALRLVATLPALAGAPASVDAAGTIDIASRSASIATVQADWKQTPIRLLAPVRVGFAAGVSVERLRLGLGEAVLEANGRITPTLALTAQLRGVPASLAARLAMPPGSTPVAETPVAPAPKAESSVARTSGGRTSVTHTSAAKAPTAQTSAGPTRTDPALALEGTLDADATLTGTPAKPSGTIHVTARGLRSATGPGRALPAADLTATATLQGDAARIDLRAKAGTTQVTVAGNAPLAAAGALDLRATGSLDLAMTDPLLTPAGRRARGRVSLDATVTGTLAAPRVTGGAQLADGSFRDFARGIDIAAINAGVTADGGTVHLTRFAAKAGPGTIEANGSLDLTAPGEPLDLTFTARGARPLANDLLTADLDADLTLRGEMAGKLTAAGRVFVRRAEIRVPERLPVGIAVLNVRVAGGPPPPPPPAPGPDLTLDLTIDAPQQIFVRGRGLNAEMGGTVRLQGSTTSPIPSGGFTLRQGDFSMAGQTLTFSTGQVSFDGGSLTDPSLNFTATTTAGDVTATLAITGVASHPKIALTSVPSLPQDEVLAYLLYGTPTASLGPLEIAQIAATLASLAGVAPTLTNPLESLRTTFGLDRLTIGAGSSLEAGRYVARNVYVGARQSVTGSGTQAVVQVDLAKGLKLEATAGTSTAGTATSQSATGAGGSADAASVGIKYEFEY